MKLRLAMCRMAFSLAVQAKGGGGGQDCVYSISNNRRLVGYANPATATRPYRFFCAEGPVDDLAPIFQVRFVGAVASFGAIAAADAENTGELQ